MVNWESVKQFLYAGAECDSGKRIEYNWSNAPGETFVPEVSKIDVDWVSSIYVSYTKEFIDFNTNVNNYFKISLPAIFMPTTIYFLFGMKVVRSRIDALQRIVNTG